MVWPSPQQYNEAVQSPRVCFADPELRKGTTELNLLGLPKPVTGSFASVYRIHCGANDYAVRCFLRDVPDQKLRYGEISKFIQSDDLEYTVGFHYLERGVLVDGDWYPVLKMDFIEGCTLDEYLRQSVGNPEKLQKLLDQFVEMVNRLAEAGIAHGDLQHGNILLLGDQLRLVDYDGMFVPGLMGWHSNELGHRNYQHPERSYRHFGPYLDNFSSWLIATGIRCLIEDGMLFADCSESLLLSQEDLQQPDRSRRFFELENHTNEIVRRSANLLRHVLEYLPDEVPRFDRSIERPDQLPPLRATGKPPAVEPIRFQPGEEETNDSWLFQGIELLNVFNPMKTEGRSAEETVQHAFACFQRQDFFQAHQALVHLNKAHRKFITKDLRAYLNFTEGWLALERRDPDKALVHFAMTPSESVDVSLIQLHKAYALSQKRAVGELNDILDSLTGNDSCIAEVQALKASIALESGAAFEDVSRLLKTALAHNPACPEAYTVLGNLSLAEGNCLEALRHFTAAINHRTSHAPAYIGRAKAYQKLGHRKRAIAEFEAAEQRFPNNIDIHLALGRLYGELCKWRDALRYLDLAHSLNPNSVDCLFLRATANLEVGNFDKALSDAQSALLREPQNPRLRLCEGMALAAKPFRRNDALACFNKIIDLQPQLLDPILEREKVLRQLGRKELAEVDYRRALTINTDTPGELLKRGIASIYYENYEHAIEDLSAIAESQNSLEYFDAYVYRSLAYKGIDDSDKAFRDLSRATRCASPQASILREQLYAELHFEDGMRLLEALKVKEATNAFSESLKYAPLNKEALWHRAVCFIKQGLYALATKDLEQIVLQTQQYTEQIELIIQVFIDLTERDPHGEYLDRMLRGKSQNHMLLFARGRLWFHRKNWSQAFSNLNGAVKIYLRDAFDQFRAEDRTLAVLRAKRGLAAFHLWQKTPPWLLWPKRRMWRLSIADFRAAVALDPDSWQGYYGLALICEQSRLFRMADYYRAVSSGSEAHMAHTIVLAVVDRTSKALDREPDLVFKADLYRLRSAAWTKLGERRKAEADKEAARSCRSLERRTVLERLEKGALQFAPV